MERSNGALENPWKILRQLGLLKVAYLLLLLGALLLLASMDVDKFFVVNQRWPREGDPIFASHFATWDTAHYLYLSEIGYNAGVHSCAFYPLWPLLVRWFSVLTGGSHLIAGLVLANLFSLTAFVVFFRLVAERLGESTAKLSLLLLLAYPGALFYQFIYTESLFFLFVALDRQSVRGIRCPETLAGAFHQQPLERAKVRYWPV